MGIRSYLSRLNTSVQHNLRKTADPGLFPMRPPANPAIARAAMEAARRSASVCRRPRSGQLFGLPGYHHHREFQRPKRLQIVYGDTVNVIAGTVAPSNISVTGPVASAR